MSVVLRCPHCGTTQGHVGECDACSEGEVRYFCTNHAEGMWLDGAVCSRCGATFGDPPRRPAPAPPPPPARVPAGPARTPDFRPRDRRRVAERLPEPDFERPPVRSDTEAPLEPELVPRTTSLGELLEAITAARARRRAASEVDETPVVVPPRRGSGVPVAGCLLRIVGLGILLVVVFVVLLLLLFGSLIGS